MLSIQHDTSVIPPRALEALTQDTNPVHDDTPADQKAMNVGLPVKLTADPGGGSLTDVGGISWSISGGDAIKDYNISSYDPSNPDDPDGLVRGYLTSCDVIALDPTTDLSGTTEIEFHFRETGTFVVTLTAEVDGAVEVETMTFDVKRDPKAEIYYVTGTNGDETPVEDRDNVMGEHYYWHLEAEDKPGFHENNPGRFFHFHRGYIGKFNCWRGIFGYPCVQIYVPGPNHLPTGREVDHVGNPGDGNGIVSEERHPSPGDIPKLPERFSITGDGSTALDDIADENELHQEIVVWHDNMHTTYLCSAGDFQPTSSTPADPIFWRFHFLLTRLFRLFQLLQIDGETIQVLQEGPGGTQVFYPDPDVTIKPDCAGGIPSTLTPASGHLFPVGTTTVTGEARDVVLLDPNPEPDPSDQEATVGAGTTTPVSFDVEIIPETADPIPADIYLVLDDTGSMDGPTPAGPGGETPTKIQALKDSMATLMDVLRVHREGVGDNIGAFTFKVPSGQPAGGCKEAWLQTLVPFGSLDDRVQNDAANPLDIDNAVAGMPADGSWTPLRTAIEEPSEQLSVQPSDRKRWIIMLTDGKQNTDDCLIGSEREPEFNDPEVVNFRNQHLASRQINLLAVGLGGGNSINEPLLRTLAAGPDDYFDFASEGPGSLSKWFDAAVTRVLDQETVVDPHGVIGTGETITEEVPLTRACRSVTFVLTWTEDDLECPPRLVVESPGAESIPLTRADHDPDQGITWIEGEKHRVAVLRFPLDGDLSGYHRGIWRARLRGPGRKDRVETTSYTLAAMVDEPVRLHCGIPQEQIRTGEPVRFTARLSGALRSANVTAEIVGHQYPIGSRLSEIDRHEKDLVQRAGSEANAGFLERRMDLVNARLVERGRHDSRTVSTIELREVDGEERKSSHKTYEGWAGPLKADGSYSVVFRAEGETIAGDRFRRECSMGFSAAPRIEQHSGDVHLEPVDDAGLVFDWRLRPGSASFDAVELGPGHAEDFSLQLSGGFSEEVIDHGDGFYTVRIRRDSTDAPANVRVSVAGEPLAAFQVPLPPAVKAVTPPSGPEEGGQTVQVHGEQFGKGTGVVFGDQVVREVELLSESLLEVTVPPGEGAVAVVAEDAAGRHGASSATYRYEPSQERDPCPDPEQ